MYFTDPPFGFPEAFDDPDKELPFSGVFRARNGEVTLESAELEGPNGLAFSPDERYLYVGNWDPERKVVMRYEVDEEGALSDGTVFHDMTDAPGEDALDGLKVDEAGNVYACGPGGIWVLSPGGRHLGTLRLPEASTGSGFASPASGPSSQLKERKTHEQEPHTRSDAPRLRAPGRLRRASPPVQAPGRGPDGAAPALR